MHILMAVPWIPYPPTDGGRVRSYYLLREIARRHTVSLFCVRNPGEEVDKLEKLKTWCHRVESAPSELSYSIVSKIRSVAHPLPFGAIHPDGEAARRLLAMAADCGADLLHLQGMEFSGCFAPLMRMRRTVYDMVDCNSQQMRRRSQQANNPARRLWSLLQARKFSRAERQVMSQPVSIILTSHADADALLRLPHHEGVHVHVVPNGVDVAPDQPRQPAQGQPRLVFAGNMGYFPNDDAVRHFCRNILPLIRQKRPEVGVDVIGKNPSADLVRFCRRQQDVAVLGFVSDMRAEVMRRMLFVCPLRIGTGIKVKVLEAMACGAAIVASSVSVEGMNVKDGYHALVADTPEAFAAQVLRLLDSPTLRQALGAQARALVSKEYAWEAREQRLNRIYEEAVRAGHQGARVAPAGDHQSNTAHKE